ncbi:MAG: hypothetical protein V1793_24985 [Pseudomonadota bacterium]
MHGRDQHGKKTTERTPLSGLGIAPYPVGKRPRRRPGAAVDLIAWEEPS